MVPYDHIDSGSGLLQMWSYVGAPKCRAIVAIGATAGLSVAMFGSMFPMPRVSITLIMIDDKLNAEFVLRSFMQCHPTV